MKTRGVHSRELFSALVIVVGVILANGGSTSATTAGSPCMNPQDVAAFVDCMAGPDALPNPTSPALPEDCLSAFDFDLDNDVDLADHAELQAAFVEFPTTSSGWVSFVDWNEATRVEVTAVEDGADFFYEPANLTFEAGKPYILVMNNPDTNVLKHYFHTPEFYQAIATRKAQTADAEYKAPYFDAFELLVGGSIELYFVPVINGTYDMWCTIPGHLEAGMEGTWTICGGAGLELDLEVAVDFDMALATDPRRSGSHAVWDDCVLGTQTVTLTEFAFDPADITLAEDVAYKLSLVSPDTNSAKHYYTAAGFYKSVVTRKAQDSQAEIKAPYLKAVELLIGGSTDLYLVPTISGLYDLTCTVPGHADAGMTGSITVE